MLRERDRMGGVISVDQAGEGAAAAGRSCRNEARVASRCPAAPRHRAGRLLCARSDRAGRPGSNHGSAWGSTPLVQPAERLLGVAVNQVREVRATAWRPDRHTSAVRPRT